jgi:hypothetical protein
MRARLMTQPGNNSPEMEILVIDVGGTHVKMVRSTQMHEKRKFDSGKTLTPWQRMPPNVCRGRPSACGRHNPTDVNVIPPENQQRRAHSHVRAIRHRYFAT